MMEAVSTSETSVNIYQTTRRNISPFIVRDLITTIQHTVAQCVGVTHFLVHPIYGGCREYRPSRTHLLRRVSALSHAIHTFAMWATLTTTPIPTTRTRGGSDAPPSIHKTSYTVTSLCPSVRPLQVYHLL
jgi:hypothetical protein